MEQDTLSQATPQTTADYEAAIDQCLAEIERLRQQIRDDDAEISRLKAETRALLAKMKAA